MSVLIQSGLDRVLMLGEGIMVRSRGTAAPPASPLFTNLSCYWKMDEASGQRDDSVGVQHLTDNNTVASAAGKINDAASFIPENFESLSRASNAVLQTGDINFALAGWAALGSVGFTGYAALLGKYGAGANNEYLIYYDPTIQRLLFAAGGVAVTANFQPVSDVFFHFVVWHDAEANTIHFKINNGTTDSTATAAAGQAGSTDFIIGNEIVDNIYWRGLVDEVAFWKNFIPSADQITWMYNSGAGQALSEYAGAP